MPAVKSLNVRAVVLCCLQYAYLRVHAAARSLQQYNLATDIQVADFSDLPRNITPKEDIIITEKRLNGTISVTHSNHSDAMYGTYFLGIDEVQQLMQAVSSEMVRQFLTFRG